MEFLELAKQRYSVRKFTDRPIDEELLGKIIEAGRIAPTAKNQQPQRVYVLKSADAMEKINALSPCIYGAPTVLMVAYDNTRDAVLVDQGGARFGEIDASIVCSHMMLEAAELGIGSCWVGRFNREDVRKAFGLPENIVVIALLPIGYAAPDADPSPRHSEYRPMDETVSEL